MSANISSSLCKSFCFICLLFLEGLCEVSHVHRRGSGKTKKPLLKMDKLFFKRLNLKYLPFNGFLPEAFKLYKVIKGDKSIGILHCKSFSNNVNTDLISLYFGHRDVLIWLSTRILKVLSTRYHTRMSL